MIDKKNITGIILSGGKSSRMGADKGLLTYNEKAFIQHSMDALQPLVSETMIVSNNSDHDAFGLKRIEDIIEDAGPLAGVYSGLNQSKTTYNLVLSCDIPLINSEVLKKLIETNDSDADIIQIESNGKAMPLIALYKTGTKAVFYELLQKGERRLCFAVNQCKVKNIKLDLEYETFTTNVNTPDQLKEITK